MEQIFTPLQVNKNKVLLLTTLKCSYLLLLLQNICGFIMFFWIYNVFMDIFIILHIEECGS